MSQHLSTYIPSSNTSGISVEYVGSATTLADGISIITFSEVNTKYTIASTLNGTIKEVINNSDNTTILKMDNGTFLLTPEKPIFRFVYIDNKWQIITVNATATLLYPSEQKNTKLVGSGNDGTSRQGTSVSASFNGNTIAVGGNTDASNKGAVWIFERNTTTDTWEQQGSKIVAGDATTNDKFGSGLALSADGNTLAIAGQINSVPNTGKLWIYTRSGTTWAQQDSTITITGTLMGYNLNMFVTISSDGNTVAIGVGNENDGEGGVWVYIRSGSTWSTQGSKLVGTGAVGNAFQGDYLALSANGNTLVVGGAGDNSSIGAAWVFTRSGATWSQYGSKLVGSAPDGISNQGSSVSISGDGTVIAMGAFGATWVFDLINRAWTETGTRLIGTNDEDSLQGYTLAISANGKLLAIGGPQDDDEAGAIWMFEKIGSYWGQRGNKLTVSDGIGSTFTGYRLALSKDGGTLVAGLLYDNSNIGAVSVFT